MRRALLGLVLAGCNIDLPDAWSVERPRIVAMDVEVAGDPERAAPLGGETVELVPIVVSPEAEDDTLSTAWLACLAAPTRTGVPSCGEEPLAVSGLPTANVVQPIAFTLPAIAPSPLGAPSVLVTVASCDSGAVPDFAGLAMGSSMLPTCVGGGEGARAELTVFSMPVAIDLETANHHPSWAGETISFRLGDVEPTIWAASPFPSGPCGASTPTDVLPRIATADPPPVLTLGWTSSPDDREGYTSIVEGSGGTIRRREALQFSHFASVGSFERAFSSVDEETPDDDATREIDWTPPLPIDVPSGGVVVRFWWVLRDLRGGLDVATRALCLVPS